jgi:hypothetical protein
MKSSRICDCLPLDVYHLLLVVRKGIRSHGSITAKIIKGTMLYILRKMPYLLLSQP